MVNTKVTLCVGTALVEFQGIKKWCCCLFVIEIYLENVDFISIFFRFDVISGICLKNRQPMVVFWQMKCISAYSDDFRVQFDCCDSGFAKVVVTEFCQGGTSKT